MIKAFITNAVVSKGYNGAPALNFSENNGTTTAVQFKIGHRVYDSRVESKHRYINMAVKAFGPICERIVKMKLTEGSYVNIIGRLDEETWEDEGQKRSRFIVIAEDIEYASKGNGKANGTNGANGATPQNGQGAAPSQPPTPAALPQQPQVSQTETPPNFTGYSGFGEENPFFPGS